ncbi:SRPBCC domain-containing protein [Microlunatus soli]|uniref:Activator of Hsp90 ATPase homolog 1-like protein n=1 Tax=Microlunatus soli TaxID=630515 RepID=A0A1H1NE91_9ACTN|nr:SRPBCC domain-containing protein [Microlunatus soli]SDR97234.1 Activator of Hsp90 ATPase homolog 1-like protein [Microlunatus soli]
MPDTTAITVRREIDADAADIFSILSNPDRHNEFDGSGFIRSADHPQRIQAVGETFRMNMAGDHMGGEYQTDNTVTGFQPGKLISWQTAPAGQQPPGWEWVYELTPLDHERTEVQLSYDWSRVTDRELLKQISFPLVGREQLEGSLAELAAVVRG